MDSPTEDCYDIFNDYLGLSNVVGSHENSVLLMKSLLLEHDRKNGPLSRDLGLGLTHDKENGKSTTMHDFKQQFYNGSNMASTRVQQVSDVERLFGRGATLQKTGTSPTTPTSGVLSSTRQPDKKISQQNFNNVNCSQHPVQNTSPPTQPMRTPDGAVRNDGNIHSALDAIISKYNSMHEQQRMHNVVGYNNNQVNPTDNGANKWINIASLTAALAKVAATYDGQQKPVGLSQFQSSQHLGETPSISPSQPLTSNVECAARFVGCSFCKNNKEVKEWFLSHQLKDSTGRVTCPVLRSYVCPLCDARGDSAHTIGHCPLNPDRRSSLPLAIRAKANATGKKKLP